MPKIDFYLLSNTNSNRYAFVCRLIEKAYKLKHRIYIHLADEKAAHEMDELLWTYRDDSFLPHNLIGEGPNATPPIQIGFQNKPDKQNDILINLSHVIPDFYLHFKRVLEFVTPDPKLQEIAREHYRIYRAAGFEITTHKLQNVEA